MLHWYDSRSRSSSSNYYWTEEPLPGLEMIHSTATKYYICYATTCFQITAVLVFDTIWSLACLGEVGFVTDNPRFIFHQKKYMKFPIAIFLQKEACSWKLNRNMKKKRKPHSNYGRDNSCVFMEKARTTQLTHPTIFPSHIAVTNPKWGFLILFLFVSLTTSCLNYNYSSYATTPFEIYNLYIYEM